MSYRICSLFLVFNEYNLTMQLVWIPILTRGLIKEITRTLKKITWNWNPNGDKLHKIICLWVKLSKKLVGNQWKKEQYFLDSTDAIIGEKLRNHMIFHSSSNHKATKSALMRDKELCRYNLMISSQARYISGICKTIANTRINESHNQKQSNKILAQSHSMNINSQKYDT